MVKTAAEFRSMYEPLRKLSNQTPEPGLGAYGYSGLEAGKAELSALEGTRLLTIELQGDVVGPTDLERMRSAMRSALGKI